MATYTYPGGPDPLILPGAEEDTIQGDGNLANSSVTVSLTGGSQTLYVHDAHVILNQTGGNDTLELNNSALTLSGSAAPQSVVFGEGANSLRLSGANYTNYGVNGMQITGMEQGDGIIAPEGYFISDFAYSGTTLTVSLTPLGDAPGGSTTHTIPITPVSGPNGAELPANSLQLNEDGTILSDGAYAGPAVCFVRGTLISTDRGEIAVESLRTGDKILCLNGVREVRWIGYRHNLVGSIPKSHRDDSFPIVIRRNAIDNNVPNRDLRVSPWHHLYIDGLLIRAKDLVNDSSIAVDRSVTSLSYYHVELDQFDMILAHGMHSESWADGGNRDFFHNADVATLMPGDSKRRLALRPGFERAAPEVAEQVRARLAERATAIGSETKNLRAA